MATFELQTIARISALRILGCLAEGTLIAVFTGLFLRFSRRQSSAVKFAMWFSALMTIAALPLFSRVAWWHGWSAPAAIQPVITVPGAWALYLFGAWAAIAGWSLLRVGVSLWHLHSLRKSCMPIDPVHVDACLRETLAQHGGLRPFLLCTSARVHVPTAVGLVKPFVVIPCWVMEELSSDEVNQILLHELAHLRRWDDWTNLAQKLVKALFFFHPAVWWIEKRVSLEREMACDDAVLAETARPRAYAECLAHLAEKSLVRRSLALAQAAIGRVRQTSLRVARILDANRFGMPTRRWKPVPLVAGFAIACGVLASQEPRLIAFQDAQTGVGSPIVAMSSGGGLRPIPAAFKPAAVTTRSLSRRSQPRVLLAKNVVLAKSDRNKEKTASPTGRQYEYSGSGFQVESAVVAPSLVRLTDSSAAFAVSSEAFFIVIQDREHDASGQLVYQIQVFRMTVLRRAVRSISNESSHKET